MAHTYIYPQGWVFCPCLKVTGTMLHSTHFVSQWLLTSFSSVLVSIKSVDVSNVLLRTSNNSQNTPSLLLIITLPLPRAFPKYGNSLFITFKMRFRPDSHWMKCVLVMQERRRNFGFLKLSFVFLKKLFSECVLEHSKLLKQPKGWRGVGNTSI
jgi:hypothetical protein